MGRFSRRCSMSAICWSSPASTSPASAWWCAAIRCWPRSARASAANCCAATEADLAKIAAATQRARNPLRGEQAIALRVGRVIERFHMAKHFALSITDTDLTWQRKNEAIAAEAALDGLYVIRTSVPAAPARCRRGGGRLQEPGPRGARLSFDQDGGPARAPGLPLQRAARARACVPVHAGLLRRVAHAPAARSPCCSTTSTSKRPAPAAPRPWPRRCAPSTPRPRMRPSAPMTACRCTASGRCCKTSAPCLQHHPHRTQPQGQDRPHHAAHADSGQGLQAARRQSRLYPVAAPRRSPKINADADLRPGGPQSSA